MNETTDVVPVDGGRINQSVSAPDARAARHRSRLPYPATGDSAHQLEPSRRKFKAFIERKKAALDLVARDARSGESDANAGETNFVELHGVAVK